MEINSIKDLIEFLENIGEPKFFHTRFFRGHSKKLYKLEPSIYRNLGFIENENNILKDAIISNPDEFSYDSGLFGILAKLQHYGYPTRLLDITANALVALYFAVVDKKDDGELIIFDIPDEYIKYYDSDIVSILSAISFRNSGFNIDQVIKTSEYNDIKVELALRSYEQAEKIKKYQERILEAEETLDIKGYMNRYVFENPEVSVKEAFNNTKEILKLLHDIRKEKSAFRADIDFKDIQKVICVKPQLDNQRIIRQQGNFLLFGIKDSKKNMATIPESWTVLGIHDKTEKIYIPEISKDNILRELNTFGINKKFLFPEMEKQAEEIRKKYFI